MDYFEPDSIWELYKVSSVEDYVEQFVVKGKFHNQIPNDIQDAWKTVEYLLAHSYYYWPMYDEGFKKALLIIEMAVKLKAKELGVSLKTKPNKEGKERNKRLSDIINEVFVGDKYETLKSDINRARNIRNKQMHPDRNSFGGVIGNIPGNLQLFVNILNSIFKVETWHKRQHEKNKIIIEKLESFYQSLLILENNQHGILVHGILGFKALDNLLLLACNPIRTDISKIITNHYSIKAMVLSIQNFEISDTEIIGQSLDGWHIKLYKTDKIENISIFNNYLKQIESCDAIEHRFHTQELQRNSAWELVKLEYESLEKKEVCIGDVKT